MSDVNGLVILANPLMNFLQYPTSTRKALTCLGIVGGCMCCMACILEGKCLILVALMMCPRILDFFGKEVAFALFRGKGWLIWVFWRPFWCVWGVPEGFCWILLYHLDMLLWSWSSLECQSSVPGNRLVLVLNQLEFHILILPKEWVKSCFWYWRFIQWYVVVSCPKIQCGEVSGSIQFGRKCSLLFGMGHVNFLVTLLIAL